MQCFLLLCAVSLTFAFQLNPKSNSFPKHFHKIANISPRLRPSLASMFPRLSCFPKKLHTLLASSTSLIEQLNEAESEIKDDRTTEISGHQKRAPATDYFRPLVEGDRLESTKAQQAIVAASSLLVAAMIFKTFTLVDWQSPFGLPLLAASLLLGYEFADFGSGVYHWAMDNYGNKDTPVFGGQIEAFQGHHELPWTITHRDFSNNIYKICQATAPFSLGFLLLSQDASLLAWASSAIFFINLSQELHKWSHSSPADTPTPVNWLQGAGVIVGRRAHLAHHRPPFEGDYCIVSGHCNPILDHVGFFRWMEQVVFRINGAQARCWTNERLLADRLRDMGIKR